MNIEVRICSNPEMICDGIETEPHRESEFTEIILDVAIRFTENQTAIGIDVAGDSIFSHWNGGRYDQFWKRCGFVAIRKDYAGTTLEDVAWKINDIIDIHRHNTAAKDANQ